MAPGHVFPTGYSSWSRKTGTTRAVQRGHLALGCRECANPAAPGPAGVCFCLAWSTGIIGLFHWGQHLGDKPSICMSVPVASPQLGFPGPYEELEEEHISCPRAARLQGQAGARVVFRAQMCSCAWDGGSLEVALWVLLSPMCALGRARPPGTDVLVWARFLLCVHPATQGLVKAFGFFRGSECSKLPSDFPCSCWKSAFLKFNFSVAWFFPLSTRA